MLSVIPHAILIYQVVIGMLSASLVMISTPNFTLTIIIYQVVIGMLSASLGGSVHGAALLWLQARGRGSVRGRGAGLFSRTTTRAG